MLNIGLGLLLYHILYWAACIFFVLLVVVPFCMNLFDGQGYGYNVKRVWHVLTYVFRMGFEKHP